LVFRVLVTWVYPAVQGTSTTLLAMETWVDPVLGTWAEEV